MSLNLKDPEFLEWHAELCREDAGRFFQDHLRYEYLRTLNVQQFQAIFQRAMRIEKFDDIIDACLRGCTPECRIGDYPGCAICMSPKTEP